MVLRHNAPLYATGAGAVQGAATFDGSALDSDRSSVAFKEFPPGEPLEPMRQLSLSSISEATDSARSTEGAVSENLEYQGASKLFSRGRSVTREVCAYLVG